MALVLFRLGGIRKELYSLQYIDLRESTVYLQHRIVHIIVIYVSCILLKYTNIYKPTEFFITLYTILKLFYIIVLYNIQI